MKKLDILPATEQPMEAHRVRLLGPFKEPMPPQAVAAVEDLLSGGGHRGSVNGCIIVRISRWLLFSFHHVYFQLE
jgi:hypothetical protein